MGNLNAKLKYEQWVPPSYRKVDSSTPQVTHVFTYIYLTSTVHFQTLVEQWIFAKYGREEFIHPERQSYTSGFMEVFVNNINISINVYLTQGYLMKKGRENNQFLPRKFVLSEIDNTIKYYVKVEVTFEPVLFVRKFTVIQTCSRYRTRRTQKQ